MARIGFRVGSKRDGAGPDEKPASLFGRMRDAVDGQKGPAAGRDEGEASLLIRTFEESGHGWFWSTDRDGRLTYLTERVAPQLSARPGDLLGTPFTDLFLKDEEGSGSGRTLPFMLARQSRFERLTLRATVSGDTHWWSVSGSPQFDARGQFTGYRGSGVDVTEQRRSSEHASRLAMYDPLTGLPNRLRMAEILEAHIAAFDHHRRPCAVMLIDLDRFKQVNDTLGHPAGDALLKQVAERLLRIVGDKERVFRLGGDEFQVVMRDHDDREALAGLGAEIIASLSQPYSIEGSRCIIGASIGVAVSPSDGRTGDNLIRNADLALYAAKGSGRGRVRFFSGELLKAAEDKRALEEDLRDALARGEIALFYQPIVNARTNITTGVEALVRWHHPVRGPISPALFIPIAEEANLIGPLGEWVMRKACEDAAGWPGRLRVAVNVSPIQFANPSLPAIVTSALAASGLSPDRLELEITEGVFLSDSAETDTMFATLKEIGVRLALDDFGTGYSSLGYLRTAPFDKIKIDQSFVRAATLPGSRNGAIIAAIVALAEALGMETTAEGIESLDQLELVRDLRVSHVQGYVYSKAIACHDLTARLETGEWIIAPSGHARQRSSRHSMYRYVGAIFGNHCRSVLIRNLSESGALVEGLDDVPIGSLLIVDFGEGQLAFARVRRSIRRQQGLEFEEPLVADANGTLGTSQRVSLYSQRMAGLPEPTGMGPVPIPDASNAAVLDDLRVKLGLRFPPPAPERGAAGDGERPVSARRGGMASTISELAEHYLGQIRGDRAQHDADAGFLNDHILPRFGGARPDELSPSNIATWLSRKVQAEDFSAATVNRIQVILGQLYILAMQGGVGGTSLFPQRDDRERSMTGDEIERLARAAEASSNPQLKFIIALLMLTGTRQRDLLEAQWDDIDLDGGIWRIPSATAGPPREICLSQTAIAVIRALPRWNDCPHLIANPRTRKPYRSFFSSWDTARMKAGLPEFEIDDLRHSATTEAVALVSRSIFPEPAGENELP